VGGTAATTAAALQALAAASQDPEFLELNFTVISATIFWTAKVAGVAFNVTGAPTGGAGTMSGVSIVIASSGPGDLSVLANYSGGALPAAGDTLIFENLRTASTDIRYGLSALSGIALAKIIFRNCSIDFGLPQLNQLGYFEYRPQYLTLNAAIIEFDCPECQLGRLDTGANQVAITVKATGTSKVNGLKTLLWKGTHASNVCYFDRGQIGVAVLAGETAVIATMNCGYVVSATSDSVVQIGSNASTVTLGTVNRTGGTLDLYCGTSGTITSKESAGLIRLFTSSTTAFLLSYAGSIQHFGSGTITNMTLGNNVSFDSTQNEYGFQITNVVQGYKGCSFIDPFKRAVAPAAAVWLGIKGNGCKNKDMTVDRGEDCIIQAA